MKDGKVDEACEIQHELNKVSLSMCIIELRVFHKERSELHQKRQQLILTQLNSDLPILPIKKELDELNEKIEECNKRIAGLGGKEEYYLNLVEKHP